MKTSKPYKYYILDFSINILWIIIGAVLAAISLEVILIPNGLIDGGITGLSIMISKMMGFSLSVLLFLLNIPFILLGYYRLGKRFAFSTTIGIGALTVSTGILDVFTPILGGNIVLLIVIGAILLGLGIGIVLRNGGALDGTDVMALLISSKTSLTVGESIFAINIAIFVLAILMFGLKGAVISIITYYIATTVVDIART